MTLDEIKLLRLCGQHLLAPTDTQTAVKDLCGVQAQFLSHALHGLSLRCGGVDVSGLLKSWTVRGTMHCFPRTIFRFFCMRGGLTISVPWTPWTRTHSSTPDGRRILQS